MQKINFYAKYSKTDPEYVFGGIFSDFEVEDFIVGENVQVLPKKLFRVITIKRLYFNAKNCSRLEGNQYHDSYSYPEVYIGEKVTRIPDNLCKGLSKLTAVALPESVERIGKYAFSGCYALKNMSLPANLRSIEDYAFEGCASLGNVYIPNKVSSIAETAFEDAASSFTVAEDNSKYKSIEGVLYQKGTGGLELFNMAKSYGISSTTGYYFTFIVPDSVYAIRSGAFRKCRRLKKLVIPNSVKSYTVKSREFDGCDELESITLPDNAVIESGAFAVPYINKSKPLPKLTDLSVKSLDYPLSRYFPVKNDYTPSDAKLLNQGTGNIDWLPEKFNKITIRNQDSFPANAFRNLNTVGITLELLSKQPIKKMFWSSFANSDVGELVLADTVSSIGFDKKYQSDIYSFPKLKKFVARGIKALPVGFFGHSPELEYLEIPFAGAGSINNTTHFGQLFTYGEGMRYITQYTESGGTTTGYIPVKLKELVLSEGCEMIPYGGLSGCNTIEKLTLPTSLYQVSDKGLYGCAKMSDIYCKGADPAVAFEHSFDGMRLSSCKVHIPYNTLDVYKNSVGWNKFYYFEEEAELKVRVIKSIEEAGVVYGLNEYRPGQTAELKAVANSGYTFVGWVEDSILLTQDATLTFTVADSRTLIALFAPLLNDNSLKLAPSANIIQFVLPRIGGVWAYKVELFLDKDMTRLYSSTDISMKTRSADDNVVLTVEGLNPETEYYYRISAQAESQETGSPAVLAQYTGSFSTLPATGISDVITGADTTVVGIYDLSGRKLEVPAKGMNILRLSNGTTQKVFVR